MRVDDEVGFVALPSWRLLMMLRGRRSTTMRKLTMGKIDLRRRWAVSAPTSATELRLGKTALRHPQVLQLYKEAILAATGLP